MGIEKSLKVSLSYRVRETKSYINEHSIMLQNITKLYFISQKIQAPHERKTYVGCFKLPYNG